MSKARLLVKKSTRRREMGGSTRSGTQTASHAAPAIQKGHTGRRTGSGFTPELVARLKTLSDVREAELVNEHLLVTVQPGAQFSGITALLVGAGAAVEDIRRGKTSLEDAFLDLVEDKD